MGVSFVFIACELYGGYLAGSIAIFADSAHLGSDILGFAISMIAMRIAQKSSSDALSYGWHRAEIIGALISVATMWIMTVWLVYEATKRFFDPPEIEGLIMIIVAVISLIFNLIQISILHQGHDHDHSAHSGHGHHHHEGGEAEEHTHTMREGECDHSHVHSKNEPRKKGVKARFNQLQHSAMLHVLGDAIMSVGIIIASIIIYIWEDLWWFDPLLTYLFAVIVAVTTIPTTKRCLIVLMEGAPTNFDAAQLKKDILALNTSSENFIKDVHDLHVWSISVGKLAMTVHVKSENPLHSLGKITDLCRDKYNLNHTVIQVEGPSGHEHEF